MANQKQNVDFKHPDYLVNLDRWNLVDDLANANNLKSYLVEMNPTDTSKENTARNEQVFKRAVFSGFTGYTQRGLVGKVFSKDPTITIPSTLDYVKDNIDGAGISLVQQSQITLKEVVGPGRAGLFIDMVAADSELSRADLDDNFATTSLFNPQQIINWKTTKVGSKIILSQVVLAMTADMPGPDGFSFEQVEVRLELLLSEVADEDTGELSFQYQIVEWRKSHEKKEDWVITEITTPTGGDGLPLDRIPFVFVGSEANTPTVDTAPMYDIAKVNQGHWNNSAIYEDSVFIVGQAQPWMSGLTQDAIDLMKTNNMYIGSGRLIGVPSQEQFGFAQAEPNTLAKEAMDGKVEMAIGLGAMMIQPGTVAKTAQQSSGEMLTQHSVLSLSASNVSEAYTDALGFMALFMNVESGEILYELNQDFIEPDADPEMLREIIAGFMSGSLPISDYHNWLKKNSLTDTEATLEEFEGGLSPSDNMNLDEDDDEI